MKTSDMKVKYCLEPDDLPNKTGNNVVSIVGLDSEKYTDNSTGKAIPKFRHNLWFRELALPLRMNNARIDILGKMLGDETDDWRGRKIALFNGASTSFGKTKISIFISLEVQDAPPGNGNPPQLPAGGVTNPEAPIGDANAERFRMSLAEQGAKYDDFLLWLKKVDRPAHDSTIGMDLADLKRSIAPLMQRFLKEFASAPLPAADEQPARNHLGDPVATPPDDDIPF